MNVLSRVFRKLDRLVGRSRRRFQTSRVRSLLRERYGIVVHADHALSILASDLLNSRGSDARIHFAISTRHDGLEVESALVDSLVKFNAQLQEPSS